MTGSAIAGQHYNSLRLKSDGTVWAWGFNDWGQLGDGSPTNRTTPARINELNMTISGQVTKGGVALAGVMATLTGGAGGNHTVNALLAERPGAGMNPSRGSGAGGKVLNGSGSLGNSQCTVTGAWDRLCPAAATR